MVRIRILRSKIGVAVGGYQEQLLGGPGLWVLRGLGAASPLLRAYQGMGLAHRQRCTGARHRIEHRDVLHDQRHTISSNFRERSFSPGDAIFS